VNREGTVRDGTSVGTAAGESSRTPRRAPAPRPGRAPGARGQQRLLDYLVRAPAPTRV